MFFFYLHKKRIRLGYKECRVYQKLARKVLFLESQELSMRNIEQSNKFLNIKNSFSKFIKFFEPKLPNSNISRFRDIFINTNI